MNEVKTLDRLLALMDEWLTSADLSADDDEVEDFQESLRNLRSEAAYRKAEQAKEN